MSGFGADTDYWGFAADGNIKLQSSSKAPQVTEAVAQDSNADNAASTFHDTFSEITCNYMTKHDTALVFYDTATAVDFRAGKVIGGFVILGIEVGTVNSERPGITISGRTCPSADTAVKKYDPTLLEISGARKATAVGVTVDTVSKLLSSSVSLNVEASLVQDSQGNTIALDVFGGVVEATNNLVGVTGVPGAAADTGWSVNTPIGNDEENTAYGTGSIGVKQNLTKM